MKLSLGELLSEIPMDAGALMGLIVIGGFVVFIALGARNPKKRDSASDSPGPSGEEPGAPARHGG